MQNKNEKMKKLLFLIVALIALAVGVTSCNESVNGDPYTFKVRILDKWSDIGTDGYGEERRSVTLYHFKYEFCVAEDSTNNGSNWMKAIEDVDGDLYHTYEIGKTYLIKEGSWNDWKFGLSVNYNKNRLLYGTH